MHARTFFGNRVRRVRSNRAAPAALGVLSLLGAILLVLGPLSWLIAGDTVRTLHGKERADALTAVRQTVLAAVAGTSVLIGVGFTARTYRLSRRGQVTERFRSAIGHLASDKLAERLGAIYSLEHVMAESSEEHNTVVAVLAAFIRENTKQDGPPSHGQGAPDGLRDLPAWATEPPADIRAAIDVLARRPERPEPRRVDLRSTTLVGLALRDFEFNAPPRLSRMFLTWADLRRADLRGADLTRAILNGAQLCHARLGSARLDHAHLSDADLRCARLDGTILLGAYLAGADLRDTRSLSAEQLSGAFIDETSRLPSELATDPWIIARVADCQAWRERHASNEPPPPPTPRPPERS
ncbi:pentapeptide repeat-containing protein [Streptomyces sp. NPDC052107]|uniref:pentapeptide repeat-containing protein n=1 Tax=Streptomyces sp. NPDC052107 TaxID=3155632 RepID=UPI0034394262